MKSFTRLTAIALIVLAQGCAGENKETSLTRAASLLRPGDVQVELTPERQSANVVPEVVSPANMKVYRTSGSTWPVEYKLQHSTLVGNQYIQDTQQWGVRITSIASGTVLDTFEKRGLSGKTVLRLGNRDGLVIIERGAYHLFDDGKKELLGDLGSIGVLRDTAAPSIQLSASSLEDIESRVLVLTGSISLSDADPTTPTCTAVRLLSEDETVVAEAPTQAIPAQKEQAGKSLGDGTEEKSWQLTYRTTIDLFGTRPALAKVSCKDATGNPSEAVTVISSSSSVELTPTVLFKPVGRTVAAAPRFQAGSQKRIFLLNGREVEVSFGLHGPGGQSLAPDVFEKIRGRYVLSIVARSSESESNQTGFTLWSGSPKASLRLAIPKTLQREVTLEILLSAADSKGNTGKKDIIRAEHDLFIPADVATSVSLGPVTRLFPAKKGSEVKLSASVLSSGLRFSSGDFPVLEQTIDGTEWTAVPSTTASFKGGRINGGDESWEIRFPYPFDDEEPLRFRLAGTFEDGTKIVSQLTGRVVGDASLDEPVLTDSSARCQDKSKLHVRLASSYACRVGGDKVRIRVVLENRGPSPFSFHPAANFLEYTTSTASTLGLFSLAELNSQVPTGEPSGRFIHTLEIPSSLLSDENSWIDFDKNANGAHSLDNYCYGADDFPRIDLRKNNRNIVTLSPYACDVFP